MRALLLLALPLTAAAARLEPKFAPGDAWTWRIVRTASIRGEMESDGKPAPAAFERSSVKELRDEVVEAAGGLPSKLRRTFVAYESVETAEIGDGGKETTKEKSLLVGKTLTLTAAGPLEKIAVDSVEPGDLRAVPCWTLLLPKGEAEKGAKWSLGADDAKSVLALLDAEEGSVSCELRSDDAAQPVVAVEISDPGGKGRKVSLSLRGELTWDAALGRPRSLELRGTMAVDLDKGGRLEGPCSLSATFTPSR